MISGYLMSNRDAFFPFVWKKFRRLIISYWIWIILSCDIFLSFFDFTPPNFPDCLWKAFAFFRAAAVDVSDCERAVMVFARTVCRFTGAVFLFQTAPKNFTVAGGRIVFHHNRSTKPI